jgi:hypothetical protein
MPLEPGSFENIDQGWRSCYGCGAMLKLVDLEFVQGLVTPTIGETLTGEDSGDTGVVDSYIMRGGTFNHGNAFGVVVLTNYTGTGTNGHYFTDGEIVDGSVGGANVLTANGDGLEKKTGLMYPRTKLAYYKGHWYCPLHLAMHVNWDAINDTTKPQMFEVHDEDV